MRRFDFLRAFFLAALAAGCPIPGLLPHAQPASDSEPLLKAGHACAVCLPTEPSRQSWKSESDAPLAEVPGIGLRFGREVGVRASSRAASVRRSDFTRGERLARAPPESPAPYSS